MLLIIFIIFIISLILTIIASLLSKKYLYDREKSSPFECGFDPLSSSRLPFSLRFFLITIIFLIFDVEIILLLPIVKIITFSNQYTWGLSCLFFIIILLTGLYHEWNQGALEWSN